MANEADIIVTVIPKVTVTLLNGINDRLRVNRILSLFCFICHVEIKDIIPLSP